MPRYLVQGQVYTPGTDPNDPHGASEPYEDMHFVNAPNEFMARKKATKIVEDRGERVYFGTWPVATTEKEVDREIERNEREDAYTTEHGKVYVEGLLARQRQQKKDFARDARERQQRLAAERERRAANREMRRGSKSPNMTPPPGGRGFPRAFKRGKP